MADITPTENMEGKGTIWERWGRQRDWQQKLEEEATRKALDLPEADTNISPTTTTNTTTQTGASGGAIAAAALAGGIPATVLAAMLGLSSMRGSVPQPATPAAPPAANVPDSAYDVLFYQRNADGTVTPINVPRLGDGIPTK